MTDHNDDHDDDELLGALRRVGGDLTFRSWTRRWLRILAMVLVIDLFLSAGFGTIAFTVSYVQHEACQRDNRFRAAYVNQWQPILTQTAPPQAPASDATPEQVQMYQAQIALRTTFQRNLDTDFAQHSCSSFVDVLKLVIVFAVGAVIITCLGVYVVLARRDRRRALAEQREH